MFPEQIYQPQSCVVPEINLEIIRHINLGQGVMRVDCTVNGCPAKRLTQDIFGRPVNQTPVWSIYGCIVAEWFALLLEDKYQEAANGATHIVHIDLT